MIFTIRLNIRRYDQIALIITISCIRFSAVALHVSISNQPWDM